MFSTLKSRLLLGVYVFLVLSIPVGAYLASQTQTTKSRASEGPVVKKAPPTATSSATKTILNSSASSVADTMPAPTPSPSSDSPTIATSFGPTLSLKVSLEGRPTDNQATKLFVGIFEGAISSNPTFILSFSVDLPADGSYSNLSLAGLTSGTQYTALIKGPAQLAASAVFTMAPTVTNLNDGQVINLLTGDLNEDNVVNSSDLTIAQKAMSSNSSSSNWNQLVDFNLDGIVNLFDIALIYNNMDKIGDSGVWVSPIPSPSASPSVGSPSAPSQGGPGENKGYWMWVPK